MRILFTKYQGAGNDFIMVDDRLGSFQKLERPDLMAALCSRHTGIGADGIIFLRLEGTEQQLHMLYYNADGAPSTFCGNGARCFLSFACDLGIIEEGQEVHFLANDGSHTGTVLEHHDVRISMSVPGKATPFSAPSQLEISNECYLVDTGSPHLIEFCAEQPSGDICQRARPVRYAEAFGGPGGAGVNVNYVSGVEDRVLAIRTYERGVENETLSCGTGVVAAALALAERDQLTGKQQIEVLARGGKLQVEFERADDGTIRNCRLTGPARHVYTGILDL